MEAIGVNIAYLTVQLLCFGMFVAAFAGVVYLSTRYAYNKAEKIDDSELVMSFTVTEDGIVIPKSVLEGAEQIQLRRTKTKLILHPVVEE